MNSFDNLSMTFFLKNAHGKGNQKNHAPKNYIFQEQSQSGSQAIGSAGTNTAHAINKIHICQFQTYIFHFTYIFSPYCTQFFIVI